MKIYNVLFETYYDGEDVESSVSSFSNRKDAVNAMNKAVEDEIRDGGYTDEEVESMLERDEDGATFKYVDSGLGWKFRIKILETELE